MSTDDVSFDWFEWCCVGLVAFGVVLALLWVFALDFRRVPVGSHDFHSFPIIWPSSMPSE